MSGPAAFAYGPRVTAGPGAAAGIGRLLPPGRTLFVTDARILALGLADAALAGIDDALVFDAVEADPSRATVEACAAAGRDAGATAVVGFGGGSPIDVAKLAAYLIGSGDALDAVWGVGRATGRRLPLVAVPTTAGTGSEATPVAVVTMSPHEKRGVSSAALVPDHAVLDATLTLGLPRATTAATGIDAMVHAIEATTSRLHRNPLSDALAREALALLAGNIVRVCEVPGDAAAREAMLVGAHLAGVAFANAPVAGVHALAYPLGTRFHVAHGLANRLMLPHVLRHNMGAARERYAALAPIVDPGTAPLGESGRALALVRALETLADRCGLPSRLAEVGVTAADLDMLAADALLQDRLLANNPCPIDLGDARALYAAAL